MALLPPYNDQLLYFRNTDIQQAYFEGSSVTLAPTLAAPWRDNPACVKQSRRWRQ